MGDEWSGRSALLRRQIETLEHENELCRNQIDSASRVRDLEELQRELERELTTKRVVVFGTAHHLQDKGHHLNSELECRLSFLIGRFAVTMLMEEWAADRPPSLASVFANGCIAYKDICTPSAGKFRTFCNAPINYPGHDGTLGPCEDAPPFSEYGPLDKQENREQWMVQKVKDEMKDHRVGLFIIGLAHLHSISMKLQELNFSVSAYSWIA